MPGSGSGGSVVNDDVIGSFVSNHRGRVIRRGDAGYEEARKLYNGMIDKRPLMVTLCADAGDVMTAVNFGRDNKLPIAIRGGGHNGPGSHGPGRPGLYDRRCRSRHPRIRPGGSFRYHLDHRCCRPHALGRARLSQPTIRPRH